MLFCDRARLMKRNVLVNILTGLSFDFIIMKKSKALFLVCPPTAYDPKKIILSG